MHAADAEAELIRLLARSGLAARAQDVASGDLTPQHLWIGWKAFQDFARMHVESSRDSGECYFETGVFADPISADLQAELDAARADERLPVLNEVMNKSSFQIGWTRQLAPMGTDEYEQVHLVYLYDAASPLAQLPPESFWSGSDIERWFENVDASAAFAAAHATRATPVGLYVGRGRT